MKESSFLSIPKRLASTVIYLFFQIHEIKMGGHQASFGARSWCNCMEKANIHFKMQVSNVCALEGRALLNDARKYAQ